MATRAFIYYQRLTTRILTDAWKESSRSWAGHVVSAIKDGDAARAQGLVKSSRAIGAHMRAKVRIPLNAALLACQRKAAREWPAVLGLKRKFAKAGGILNDPERREKLRAIKQRQMETFVEEFPDRFLDPEISRLIDLMPEYETAREVDLEDIGERAERMLKGEAYWEGLSNVEVSRLWHADGIALAKEQGIGRMIIMAMMGAVPPPCDVCEVMHGQEVDVDSASDKFAEDGEIEDPKEYAEAWSFPRFNEVQLMSGEEITGDDHMPPFHLHCRCTMVPLSSKEETETEET